MTKNEFRKFAKARGYRVTYSGKSRKFYITKYKSININELINSK